MSLRWFPASRRRCLCNLIHSKSSRDSDARRLRSTSVYFRPTRDRIHHSWQTLHVVTTYRVSPAANDISNYCNFTVYFTMHDTSSVEGRTSDFISNGCIDQNNYRDRTTGMGSAREEIQFSGYSSAFTNSWRVFSQILW